MDGFDIEGVKPSGTCYKVNNRDMKSLHLKIRCKCSQKERKLTTANNSSLEVP